jgi:NTE family protein
MEAKIHTLVLSGGGVKGIAYCGVIKKLEELQGSMIDIKKVCCVSVGSIFGLAYVLGYRHDEIKDELLNKNFAQFKDIKLANFFTMYGLDSGNNIMSWVETLMLKKGCSNAATFNDLYARTNIHMQVLATNLNKQTFAVFDHIQTPDVKLTTAIRLSISIPFVFAAQRYLGDVHVDGGVLDNYPIHLVEEDLPNVLGIRLVAERIEDNKIEDMNAYVANVMSCLISQRHTSMKEKYKKYTMLVQTGSKNQTVNFALTRQEKLRLIKAGYEAADRYFAELEFKKEKNSR